MTKLRDALEGLAAEAPLVSLADAAIAVHRRRRRTTLAAVAVAAVAVLTGTATVWPLSGKSADIAAPQLVPDLPGGRVGPVGYAYRTPCTFEHEDCGAVEWRVVMTSGRTYRVPQALVSSAKDPRVPVAISRDGRMLAYYSHDAQAHVVRDLVSGAETTSPVKVAEDRIGIGSMLAVSDDGRHVAFDPREGTKDPGLLIDMRTGTTVSIPGAYEVISVKDGVAELIRYRKTDLWLMPVTGGGKPMRFAGAYIMASELAPDGRTVAAVKFAELGKRTLTLLDVKTGRVQRKVTVRGLPKNGALNGTATWISRSEVTVVARDRETTSSYAVDVGTGKARRLEDFSNRRLRDVTLPGVSYSWP